MANAVGKQEVLNAANSLEELLHNTVNHMTSYGHHTEDLHASGTLTGMAGQTNVVSGNEIQQAVTKITTRWNTAIEVLRNSVGSFDSSDSESAGQLAQVASNIGDAGLRHI